MKYYISNKVTVPKYGPLPQILRVMRITAFLLLATLVQVSASGFGQKITYTQQNTTLLQIFDQIRNQTGYDVLWSATKLNTNKTLDVNFNNTPLTDVLDKCLSDLKVTYTIEEKTIVIKAKTPSFLERLTDRWAAIDVHGRVVDQEGKTLPGATVKVKSTGKSVSANGKGEFYLEKVDEGAVLVISFIGYVNKEVTAEKELGNIILELSDSKLDEVQVIAYGTQIKKYSTSNIGTVTAEEIARQPVSNPLLALSGRTPGVYIQQISGVTAANVKVNVQGSNSLLNSNDPFYVIDGVPYSPQFTDNSLLNGAIGGGFGGSTFNFINPADIESITILKDADATAIYGSRAANGAILITTKKGKPGKTSVNFNLQNGWGKVTRKLDLVNTREYLELRKEAYKNDGTTLPTSTSNPTSSNYDLTFWDQNKYTDWQKELVGGTAHYTDLQGSISGGSQNTQFLAGYGYHRETTVYPGDFSDQKGNVKLNVNHTSTDNKFKFLFSGSYLLDRNQLGNGDLMGNVLGLAPNTPDLRLPDGSLNWAYLPNSNVTTIFNPLTVTVEKAISRVSNLLANNTIGYEIIPGLELKSTMGYSKLSADEVVKKPLEYFRPTDISPVRTASYLTKSIATWNVEPQLTFVKNTDFGIFDFLLGSTFQETKTDVLPQSGYGFLTDSQMDDLASASTKIVGRSVHELYKYSAVFSRLNYRLKDKYILNLTVRRDGSSRFGDENKLHTFYAVGGAWLFADETFVRDRISWLTSGKLRANYGTTGNDQIRNYRYLSYLENYIPAAIPYQNGLSLYPTSLANPFIQWEETRKLNLGVDLGFWSNRIMVNFSYARNRSSNQLIENLLPSITGFYGISENFPALVQNSNYEGQLNVEFIKNKSFTWNISGNVTFLRNKLVSFPKIDQYPYYSSAYNIGYPLSTKRVYNFAGVNSETGLYQFVDSKGGLTSAPKDVDRTVLVNTDPKYFGGVSNSLSYKGFALDFLFQFVKQVGVTYRFSTYPGYINTPPLKLTYTNRWQKPGDVTDIQKVGIAGPTRTALSAAQQSSAAYGDASFVRLKNASLSYTLPFELIQRLRMTNARIYAQGQNLLTFTRYKGGDPETQSAGVLPPLRLFTVGLQTTF